jgi:glycosyltransferase involved in cell wall biosynthesis
MKAAIVSPYLDTLGGGERYTVSFAKVLNDAGYDVDIQWSDAGMMGALKNRFGINLEGVRFVDNVQKGDGYDVCFWVSDGSIPALRARYNFLHFQVPFRNVNGKTLLNRMKLFRIKKVICNSFFTKSFIDEEYGVDSIVIYPPVDVSNIKPKRKENIILSVGRFSQLTQAKNQDVLVDVFKKLERPVSNVWKLVLAGGTEVGADEYLKKLNKISKNTNIEIIESPSFDEIKDLFGRSKIYWTAAGFGVNEEKEPMRVEHFGISLVESMAAKCVPIAYSAGGHKEIIADGENGFLWRKKTELMQITHKLISNNGLVKTISQNARSSSLVYEYDRFEKEVLDLL